MSSHLKIAIYFCLNTFFGLVQLDNTISISSEPPSRQLTVGESIKISCTLQYDKTVSSVLWMRQTGDLVFGIGVDQFLYSEQIDLFGKRYSLEQSAMAVGRVSFTLTIKDSLLEDASRIQCVLSPQKNMNTSLSFAVCVTPGNRYCECVMATGWAAPDCLINDVATNLNDDYYRKTALSLGIALIITVIYAIVIGIIFGKDCMSHMFKDFVENQRQEKHLIAAYHARKRNAISQHHGRTAMDEGKSMDTDAIVLMTTFSDTCSDSADTAVSSAATNYQSEAPSSGYQGSCSPNSSLREKGRRGQKHTVLADISQPPLYCPHTGNNLSPQNISPTYHKKSSPIINNISGLVGSDGKVNNQGRQAYLRSNSEAQKINAYLENTPGTHI